MMGNMMKMMNQEGMVDNDCMQSLNENDGAK
jgi:hypothetical protein